MIDDHASVLLERRGRIALITLNRPERLNAWDRPMRQRLVALIQEAASDDHVRALVLTGAGDRAFGAGQDLSEAQHFDADRAEAWMGEWGELYGAIRTLTKPLVVALNGIAAGSAFQVALLGDIRIGHTGVRMGQPEINSGIPSVTGPWLMREMLGLSRTIELTLSGRMMDAAECHAIGLIHQLVPQDDVLSVALQRAGELADKPPIAMALTKARFREVTESAFQDSLRAGAAIQNAAYASGEPARQMQKFFQQRAQRKQG